MSKAGAGIVAPMGFTYDDEASVIANARAAWESHLTTTRRQQERNASVAARRIFRAADDLVFVYETFAPQTPTFEIEDERIAFINGKFELVDFCGECGHDWRLYSFGSLAGFGGAIQARDDEPDAYVCRACEWKNAVTKKKAA